MKNILFVDKMLLSASECTQIKPLRFSIVILHHSTTNQSVVVRYKKNDFKKDLKSSLVNFGLPPSKGSLSELSFKYISTITEEPSIKQTFSQLNLVEKIKGKTFSLVTAPEVIIHGDKARVRLSSAEKSKANSLKPSVVAVAPSSPSSLSSSAVKPNLSVVNEAPKEKIKVLVVDDSKTIRSIICRLINENDGFEVVAQAENPLKVEDLIKQHNPDVMTLDINMPEMTGVELLEVLLPKKFIPTVVVSSLNISEGTQVIKAMEIGAVDYLQKPSLEGTDIFKKDLWGKLKIASTQKRREKTTTPQIQLSGACDNSKFIAIGASTGGTEAIKDVLVCLPKNIPPIVIVQHIPAFFSKAFADRLNDLCAFEVKEAEDGDELIPGRALVAPGGFQMDVVKSNRAHARVKVYEGGLVSGHKPSVDVMFSSIAKMKRKNVLGIIMTGMGGDGAKGLKELKDLGCHTIGQDQDSCVVYGMPKVAMKLGAVTEQKALNDIPAAIMEQLSSKKASYRKSG